LAFERALVELEKGNSKATGQLRRSSKGHAFNQLGAWPGSWNRWAIHNGNKRYKSSHHG
jgi:hypothetical protein